MTSEALQKVGVRCGYYIPLFNTIYQDYKDITAVIVDKHVYPVGMFKSPKIVYLYTPFPNLVGLGSS
jgi:hypothetical protein